MSIRVEQLTKRYGGRSVVSNLTLEVASGELCVLLGPSGSGKSTVLRLIAGLAAADSGRVLVEDRDLAGVPAGERDLGFVFQSYALFRRMTVAGNVEFGLAVRGTPRAERRRRREELLDLVGLAGLGRRYPHQLSGGQQQRVALARALAHRPKLLLLDEPFGALDARTRVDLRRNLRAVQRELGVTTLFVTHDQDEAFELGDRIAVLAQGRLVEEGPPRELYLRPATEFVATFLGGANLLVGQSTRTGVRLGPVEMPLAAEVRSDESVRRVQVLFRPEDVALVPEGEPAGVAELGVGTVEEVAFVGASERLRLRLPALPGVRVIQPPVPFGGGLLVDAVRPQGEARKWPLAAGARARVVVRRLHALQHPGLSFLVVGGGPAEAYAAELTRLSQARLRRVDRFEDLLAPGDAEPVDLKIVDLAAGRDLDAIEALLESGGEEHLLLVRGPRPLPPKRFLAAVAVGEPGKEDVAFLGRLARHLGAPATVLTVLALDDDEAARAAAERFLDGCVRTLGFWGVAAEPEAVRGELASVVGRRLRDGHDLLAVGSPLPDEDGRLRWGRATRALLEVGTDEPILIVRSRAAERRRRLR